jgi:hypothetical protein
MLRRRLVSLSALCGRRSSRSLTPAAVDHGLWRFLISFRSSRAIMSVTLNSLAYGPRHSCLSPWYADLEGEALAGLTHANEDPLQITAVRQLIE